LGFAYGSSILIISAAKQGVRNLSELLRSAGYEVEIASEAADQKHGLPAVQLVILFIFKSFWTVIEACKICATIRNNAPDLPIIVVGPDHLDTKVSLFEVGADDYLPVSFDHQEFLARVKAFMKRHKGI
jgi:DNA-binding response OmpR family regulator